MVTKKFTIYQGDTGPLWSIGFDDERVLTNYTCAVAVRGTAISRAVVTQNGAGTRFLVQLTPTETGTLSRQTYVVGIQVSNATTTPPFVKETHVELAIQEQVVA